MKNLYFVLLFSVSLLADLTSQNVLQEDFIYAPSDSLENMGNWYRSGINFAFNIKVVTPGLEYAGYVGSGLGNACQLANAGNGDVLARNLSAPITSGAAYLSFMFRADNLPATVTEGYCIAFNPNTGGTNLNTSLHIKRLSNTTFNLGVQKEIGNDVVYSNTVFNTSKTYLVVLKYTIFGGTNNDVSSMYVFETGVPAAEPNSPLVSNIAGSDYTGQGAVHLVNNYAQSGLTGFDIKIDGIRVGTSWTTSVLSESTSSVIAPAADLIPNQIFPNPFRQATNIQFQLPHKGDVSIRIFDASGGLCAELLHDTLEEGTHEITWNAADLPAGMYTCQIRHMGTVVGSQLLKIN